MVTCWRVVGCGVERRVCRGGGVGLVGQLSLERPTVDHSCPGDIQASKIDIIDCEIASGQETKAYWSLVSTYASAWTAVQNFFSNWSSI